MTHATRSTIGMDLGDRFSHFCVLDAQGIVREESRVRMTPEALKDCFEPRPPAQVILEAGTHSPWVSRALAGWGHEVVVANARALPTIYANERKNDRSDALRLAELGRIQTRLLRPIHHGSKEVQADRTVLGARDALVRARTQLVNFARGVVKSHGSRLPRCSAERFARTRGGEIPTELRPSLASLLEALSKVSEQIAVYDKQIEKLCAERYPATQVVGQPSGVGPITSLAFVLSIEDPKRFRRSRSVPVWIGLVPRQDQSGAQDRQLRISKAGNGFLRRLLVGSAQYILGPFGPDTDLRRFGQALSARGGRSAKKRAVVAVARKLAVVMHRLWVTGEVYEPLRSGDARAAAPPPSSVPPGLASVRRPGCVAAGSLAARAGDASSVCASSVS